MPSSLWRAPAAAGSVYQHAYQPPAALPRHGLGQQQYRIPAAPNAMPPKAMELSTSFYPADARFSPGPWDPMAPELVAMTPAGGGGGMAFADHDQVATPIFSASTADGFDDFAKAGDEPWEFRPMSPDRRSWSELSTDSGEGAASEFADGPELYGRAAARPDPSAVLDRAFDDGTPKAVQARVGRSSSRPPTHPRHRRYRSSPYAVNRTRSSSSSTALSSLPRTQCCSPLAERKDDFLAHDFHDLDFPILGSPSTALFDAGVADFADFYPPKPAPASRPAYACDDDLFAAPPFEPPFRPHGAGMLPSSDFYGFPHADRPAPDDGADGPEGGYADEPDLFGPLAEEPSKPDRAAMEPENADMAPSEQELRFDGDLYTPTFVRGHGNKREGYCGLCKPGRWLVLKNSAYWYDKSFTHGISAATGLPFDAPKETRRMSGNPDVWEGLCGSCGDWIALISNKKKGTTWFRHAYKVGGPAPHVAVPSPS
jgi:hypothetical protein